MMQLMNFRMARILLKTTNERGRGAISTSREHVTIVKRSIRPLWLKKMCAGLISPGGARRRRATVLPPWILKTGGSTSLALPKPKTNRLARTSLAPPHTQRQDRRLGRSLALPIPKEKTVGSDGASPSPNPRKDRPARRSLASAYPRKKTVGSGLSLASQRGSAAVSARNFSRSTPNMYLSSQLFSGLPEPTGSAYDH